MSALDWAPTTNNLLSCSHDRNIYVWTEGRDGWTPALVVHQLNRAAVCSRWSAAETKFAVGSGAKAVCVCYYEARRGAPLRAPACGACSALAGAGWPRSGPRTQEENNWWVGKIIKDKHGSTVLSVAWHPNNLLLATASSDFKARGGQSRPPPRRRARAPDAQPRRSAACLRPR